jgi:hypothetical protein
MDLDGHLAEAQLIGDSGWRTCHQMAPTSTCLALRSVWPTATCAARRRGRIAAQGT